MRIWSFSRQNWRSCERSRPARKFGLSNTAASARCADLKQPRNLVGPAEDLDVGIGCCRFDGWPKFIGPANGHGEIDAKIGKPLHEFGRVTCRGMDHVENSAFGIGGRELSILRGIGKFWTYRKTKHLDFVRSDSGCSQDRGALFVGSEEVIGGAAIPDFVDGDRFGHDNDAFAEPVGPQDLLK